MYRAVQAATSSQLQRMPLAKNVKNIVRIKEATGDLSQIKDDVSADGQQALLRK